MTDLVGQRFGTRTVLAAYGRIEATGADRVKLICDCGAVDIVRASRVQDPCPSCVARPKTAATLRAAKSRGGIASNGGTAKPRPAPKRKPRARVECPACGGPKSRDGARCMGCRYTHDGALIDGATRYTRDYAAQVIVQRWPDGAPLELIGAAMGVTRERARQIEASALATFEKRLRLVGITPEMFAEHIARRSDSSWSAWGSAGELAAGGA